LAIAYNSEAKRREKIFRKCNTIYSIYPLSNLMLSEGMSELISFSHMSASAKD
jgi:hypothetical protein